MRPLLTLVALVGVVLLAGNHVNLQGRGEALAAQATAPTFAKDVAPILYASCVSCHRPGEMGPMPLITYQQVRPWARSIRERVASRDMPPWHADPAIGHFRNDRSLRRTSIRWWRG